LFHVKLSPLREPLNIAFHLISPSPHPQPSEPVVHAFLTVASGTAIASSQPRLTPSVALTRRFGGSSRARLSRKHPERTSVKKCGPCRRPNPLGQPASTSVSRHRTRHSERAAPTSVRCSRPCHSLIRQSTAAWKFPAVRAFHVKHRTRAPRPNRAPHAAMTQLQGLPAGRGYRAKNELWPGIVTPSLGTNWVGPNQRGIVAHCREALRAPTGTG
jgi:hypothetical protein